MKQFYQKIILFCFTLLTVPYSMAVNTDESTRYVYWLMLNYGINYYSLIRDGGYTFENQYYHLGSNLALNIVVRNNQNVITGNVNLSSQDVGDLIRQAISTINTLAFTNFRETTTGRALRIDIERHIPNDFPGFAVGFAPRAPREIFLSQESGQEFVNGLFTLYFPTGGIAIMGPTLENNYISNSTNPNFVNSDTYNYLMDHQILPQGTTIADYARMNLRYIIMHEFMHVFGAVHGAPVGVGQSLPPIDDMVYNPIYASEPIDGGLLYNYNNPALVNSGWRPSVVAPSFSQQPITGNIIFQCSDNYFVNLSNQLGRPIQLHDIRPALQDVNMLVCDAQFIQDQQQAQHLPQGQQQLCQINQQPGTSTQQPVYVFMNYPLGVAGLLTVGITQESGIFFNTIYGVNWQ